MDQVESDISDEDICTRWKQKSKTMRRTRLLSSDSSLSEDVNGEGPTHANSDAHGRNIEQLADLTIEESRPKKINSRSSESLDGDDELSRNEELPADLATAKRRRRKRLRVQQRSSSSESVEDETEFRSATPSELFCQKCSSPSTLDDLPDEIMNRILTKVIIKKRLTAKPVSSFTDVDSKRAISRLRFQLRGVSSNWNSCLSSELFEEMLDSTVNQLVPAIQSVALKFVAKLDRSNVIGVTTLDSKIYVLENEVCCTVRIYEGGSMPPAYLSQIDFEHIRHPTDIISCKEPEVLYIGGRERKCIWKISVSDIHDDTDIQPWMENIENVDTFSATSDGRLLIPRNKPFDHIGVYDCDARLIHRIFLPACASYPGHVVQKSNGNVILSHDFSFSLSELNPDGRFVHGYKFRPKKRLLEFRGFLFNHFVLDADERVIAVNVNGQEIICIDPTLRIGEVIATELTCVACPSRVHYDKENCRLVVVGLNSIAFLDVLYPL